jgi:UBX domain-containing protein 6
LIIVIPELDRDIQIFQSSSTTHLPDIDLSDEFYNATIDEIKQQQKMRNDALESQGILRTKQMRERDEKMEQRMYNYSLVRVRFPDDYILQAVFKSKEKMRDLNEFVQDCLRLKSSFEFFGHSIKKTPVANEDFLNVTLAEAGLAPSALINFRYTNANEQSSLTANKSLYIRDDLIQRHLKNL